jgi:predicted AlkP superfamily phosphohydrolase/phosphomutase
MLKRLLLLGLAVAMAASQGCGEKEQAKVARRPREAVGRVVVVGFDGLSPVMVDKWVKEGKLPNMARVMKEGAFGNCMTVLPPSSASAWTSAITGVNPGKHGIYGFLKELQEGKKRPAVFNTSRDRGFSAVWDVLSEYGRRSCIINIPLTSPADTLDGVMIAGFPHTSEDQIAHFWPPELEKYMGSYKYDAFRVTCAKGEEEKFLRSMEDISAKRLDVGLTLFDEGGWDLFWIVFTFTDRTQHYMWKYMDEEHPLYDPDMHEAYGDRVEWAYKRADTFLGEFMKRLTDDDLLMVMSDHGFGPLYYIINTRNFLQRTLGNTEDVLCADFFGSKFKIDVSGRNAEERFDSIRNRLIEGLKDLEDPDRGGKIIDSIYVKEDIYEGPYVSQAPDVLCLEKPGYLFFSLQVTPDLRLFDRGPSPDRAFSGFHRRMGTLMMYGNAVAPGVHVDARIIDITPTILTYLGVPVPAEMDGSVPSSALKSDFADRVILVRSEESGYKKPTGLNGQDWKKIENQLRAVGYIQ